MIRSTYRNLMIAILAFCLIIAFFVFRQSQEFQAQILERQNDITRLQQELENAQTLNVALTELDSLTITEQTATQLDILRHLGLEQSNLDFVLESRDVLAVGNTNLYVHNVRISGNMPYAEALALTDRLQNTKKIVINHIELGAPNSTATSNIALSLNGKIYGLDKVLPPPGTAPALPGPEAIMVDPAMAVSPTMPQPAGSPSPSSPAISPSFPEVSQ